MLDDLFEGLLDALFSSKNASKRSEVVIRMLFGLMGVALSVAGIYHMMGYDAGWRFRLASAAMLFFLACFCAYTASVTHSCGWMRSSDWFDSLIPPYGNAFWIFAKMLRQSL